jgi:D-alanyl-D-alanine carboxypeptidase/D-alanyl-D-alanine-endopeptidase (penicillin-binding protein 4)
VLAVSVDNPTRFFVQALRRALIARGVDVRGPAVVIDDLSVKPDTAQALLINTHRSPPLSTLAVRLMKASQNQYAETLLKTLGAATAEPPRGASALAGRTTAQTLLEGWGIGRDELIQRDGSGLTRYDYVSAQALVTILSHVYNDEKLRGPFEASLPVAGGDGTLARRMKGTPAEGRARAKTGSMSNVRALSGYVTTAGEEPVVFSILANNFETPPDLIEKATDAIVVALAGFRR